jgi:hypothetical protein
MAMSDSPGQQWLRMMDDEDLNFIKRFVMASGSLKELAAWYGISYPTVRLRLDRLIQKIQVLEEDDTASPFERELRLAYSQGKIDMETSRTLLRAYKHEREKKDE